MSVMTILGIIFGGLVAYFLMGFFVASLITKFEEPTSWSQYTRTTDRWCESVSGFVLIGIFWPVMGPVCGIEQIAWKLNRSGDSIQSYIKWLRRELPSKEKQRGIEA